MLTRSQIFISLFILCVRAIRITVPQYVAVGKALPQTADQLADELGVSWQDSSFIEINVMSVYREVSTYTGPEASQLKHYIQIRKNCLEYDTNSMGDVNETAAGIETFSLARQRLPPSQFRLQMSSAFQSLHDALAEPIADRETDSYIAAVDALKSEEDESIGALIGKIESVVEAFKTFGEETGQDGENVLTAKNTLENSASADAQAAFVSAKVYKSFCL